MPSGTPIRDVWFRVICIPAFGAVIPNAAGLWGTVGPSQPAYWLGYLYFTALSATIWHGNRWALFKQRTLVGWFDRPWRKIALLLAAIVLFTAPLTVGALAAWYAAIGLPPDRDVIREVTLINIISVVFITHVYETAFLIKEREADLVQVERLERARVQATLDALRAQISPHFLFNSLTTLAQLIETAPDRAREFNANLARVYRYILKHRHSDLVTLADELAFVDTYFSLLRLRFGDALNLSHELGTIDPTSWCVPPISVQTLVENAVKHNAFDEQRPMDIAIRFTDRGVEVENQLRTRVAARTSAKLGLVNLDERCRLTTTRGITISDSDDTFTVTLPALELAG